VWGEMMGKTRDGANQGLTALRVKTLAEPGLYPDGRTRGLYLKIAKGLSKSWIYRYQRHGKRRDMGLGSADVISLAEAREDAFEARRMVTRDIDPIETRRAERRKAELAAVKTITFFDCAKRYIAAHRSDWRSAKHAQEWPSTLENYVYPVFGSLPVQAVDVGLVLKAIEPLWIVKPETASRVRGRIELVLDWATARGHRQGDNPARWRGHLENLLPKRNKARDVVHLPALPFAEVGAFMAELRRREGIAERALEFAILTAARRGEVIGAKCSEINMAERAWIVPGSRMKSGREHRVPLSEAAIAIIEAMAAIRHSDLLFPGTKTGQPIDGMGMVRVLRRMGRGDFSAHGFRSAFRDWAAERTAFPAQVAEMALGHVVGDAVERAYRRGNLLEKRRQLMAAWAKYCGSPQAEASVVPIRVKTA
jgi:integrase